MKRTESEEKGQAAGAAAGRKAGGRKAHRSYEAFMERLEARIPDERLVDQLERELGAGGEEPDLKAIAVRQKARQDIEAHKGYRRAGEREAREPAGLVVRIVRFAGQVNDESE